MSATNRANKSTWKTSATIVATFVRRLERSRRKPYAPQWVLQATTDDAGEGGCYGASKQSGAGRGPRHRSAARVFEGLAAWLPDRAVSQHEGEDGRPGARCAISAPLLEKAGLPKVRFHDLRHTCATLLLTKGVHPKFVQELLGHATTAITLDTCSHVMPGMGDAAARAMKNALSSM
ncbi:MAG: tyrosine-type recombinase/integrase [Rubrobacteraceae bacterium]